MNDVFVRRTVAAVIGVGAALRGARLFHPRGVVFAARFTVHGRDTHGVPLLDHPGEFAAIVRLSKAVSTPGGIADVLGLAVRIHNAGGEGVPVDLALATTGSRPGLRHILIPRRDFASVYTSLLPYQAGARHRVIGAVPVDPARRIPTYLAALPDTVATEPLTFRIMLADLTGPWQPVATLTLTRPEHGEDPTFDVTTHALEQLHPHGWLNSLRGPAYRASQRARGTLPPAPPTRRAPHR
ncbi:hypothetical protein BS329_36825 [Amycolatopsis coloradensis]|uniref:Phosphodiesterase n=1 Tax=Amycolatopsis coloradensis TaxID=76021 RepID=A0A1R0KFY6_9PSEU|nr:hypothetical protein [Amycolatopsis coloradensis]OLZ44401.1 hypothetical protein BS329_36825 [Amycolatopsis coloradensis]